jgi:hypothetical protein
MGKAKPSTQKVKQNDWRASKYSTLFPEERRLFHLLGIFVRSPENKEGVDSLAELMTKEKSVPYLLAERIGIEKGKVEGAEKKSYEVVKNLLRANKFTVAEIANFANVPEIYVKKVKKTLVKKTLSKRSL